MQSVHSFKPSSVLKLNVTSSKTIHFLTAGVINSKHAEILLNH